MRGKKGVQWLYGQLPDLVAQAVIPQDIADRISEHYGPAEPTNKRAIALFVCGVVGGGLIGLGIILVLASNWAQLSRGTRAVLAFTPLVVSQALSAWVLLKKRDSLTLKESTALFQMLSVAAAIALISQTYQIPGDLGNFLFVWMLLSLPLVYLMDASIVAIGYIAGITAWTAYIQSNAGNPLSFWLLAAGIAPYTIRFLRQDLESARTTVMQWAVAIGACVAIGFVLEGKLPGIWILVYSGLFSMFFLTGSYWLPSPGSDLRRPFHTMGAGGIAVMALIYSFEWPWEEIGWDYYRSGLNYHVLASYADYLYLFVLLVTVSSLLAVSVRRGRSDLIPLGSFPLIAVIAYTSVAISDAPIIAMVLFNVYVFSIAVWTIAMGIRAERFDRLNGGMLLLSALIVFRFFDTQMSFALRGVVFIIIGAGFLATNLIIINRRKGTK